MHTGGPREAVPRPRLAGLIDARERSGSPVRLVAAIGGSGFGKSVFVRWLATTASAPAVHVELDGPTGPAELMASISSAARRDGLSDFVVAVGGADADDVTNLRAAVTSGPPVTLVVDEVGRLDDEAAQLLAAVMGSFRAPGRLLVAGRTLPAPLLAAAMVLDEGDLAFDESETAALLAVGSDGSHDAATVFELTGGWPAAVAVAAARAAARRATVTPSAALPDRADVPTAVRALACLPLLSSSVAELVGGPSGLALLTAAGVPVVARADGWVELAEPVRDRLADEAALPLPVRRRVASVYADLNRPAQALALLIRVDDLVGVAELLGSQHFSQLEQLGLPDLRRVVDLVPDEVFAERPDGLLAAIRATERIAGVAERTRWLHRAVTIVPEDAPARGLIEAELARVAIREGDLETAVTGAELALTRPSVGDRGRGRALVVLGSAAAYREDPAGLREGARQLTEAIACLRRAGDSRWEAEAQMILANGFDLPNARVGRAAESAGRAVSLLADVDEVRATYLTFLSEIHCWVPDLDAAQAALIEADAIVARSADDRMAAYVQWAWAQVAGRRQDAVMVRERVAAVLRHPGSWYSTPAGLTFHGDAAELLAGCGDEAGARAQIAAGEQRPDGTEFPHMLQRGRSAVAARFDDPLEAAKRIHDAIDGQGMRPIDRPRMMLLASWCAHRAGDDDRARAEARAALAAASTLDHPAVLTAAEPELAAWAAELLGAPVAPVAFRISVLGGMSVMRGGADLTPPPGLPQVVVALLAVSGPQPREALVDLLWPDVDLTTGLSRLRNLLNRIRAASGDLIRRRGALIELDSECGCDLWDLRAAVAQAVSAPDEARFGLARQALARWGGILLPLFDDEWAVAPREQVKAQVLELLDLVAQISWKTGDLDEAARHLERGIELEPYEEIRYVRLGRAFLRQGRRGAAADIVRRALAALSEIGLPAGPRLRELQTAV